jgi:hypothetical protein
MQIATMVQIRDHYHGDKEEGSGNIDDAKADSR